MSDPKTSQNSSLAFQDRLYVVGNASFVCLIVAAVWTFLFIGKASLSGAALLLLSAPLIATGITVLVGAIFKDLVPKPVIAFPLNLTIPIVWCLCCYLAILLIATQETGSTRVPEPLLPALVWSKLSHLLPVLVAQVAALSMVVLHQKARP